MLAAATRVLAAISIAAAAGAQSNPATPATPGQIIVRVRVVDTAGAAVSGADVSVLHGLQEVLSHGTTDNAGRAALSLSPVDGDVQVSVRKIGYLVGSQFVARSKVAVTSVEIILHRAAQSLAPVAVTASQDFKRKSYFIDADDIANSPRAIIDGMDIVTKLRPDIMAGRSGSGCGVKMSG